MRRFPDRIPPAQEDSEKGARYRNSTPFSGRDSVKDAVQALEPQYRDAAGNITILVQELLERDGGKIIADRALNGPKVVKDGFSAHTGEAASFLRYPESGSGGRGGR
jgi:hypothetical protein